MRQGRTTRAEGLASHLMGISYRAMSVLDQAKLMRAVGSDNSSNVSFMGLAMMAAAVVDIDGTPAITPRNLQQVDAAIERLGDEGYVALSEALLNTPGGTDDSDDEIAAAKN
jgi:hypothetical protein